MSDTRTLSDLNRLNANLNESQVDTVIPEHFKEQYPNLVTFLKKYYEFMDNEGGITHNLKNIFTAKDAESTSSELLDLLFNERSPGFPKDQYIAPTFAYKQLPEVYKTKGTNISVDRYFRYFFQQEIEKNLPRNDMLIVGESKIGAESLKYIQDSYFYQVYSIQLKSGIPSTQWLDYYKSYLHPAGYALFTQTSFNTTVSLKDDGSAINGLTEVTTDDDLALFIIASDDEVEFTSLSSTSVIDSSAQGRFAVSSEINIYQSFEEETATLNDSTYSSQYISIGDILNVNSRRFSDSDDSTEIEYNLSNVSDITLDEDSGSFDTVGFIPGIRFSSETETIDKDLFPFYNDSGLDSAIGPYV
jgi:hypothetical protein